MSLALACSSDPEAERAAHAVLADGGGSVDAVIAGFLGAAGADPAVLLSPAVVLLGGVAVGMRCLDGRMLQPGRDLPRPRGFVTEEDIPESARVAVPRAVGMLALLHTYGAKLPFAALARQGTSAAKRQHAPGRARLLSSIERHGAAALRGPDFSRLLLRAAGAAAGGLLSDTDLRDALPGDSQPTRATVSTNLGVAVPPWPAPAAAAAGPARPQGPAHVLLAADERGVVVALSYVPDPGGVDLPELEIKAARDAAPVMRGVPRITPGTPRAAPAPVALLDRREEGWFAAAGVAGAAGLMPTDLTTEAAAQTLRGVVQCALGSTAGDLALAVSAQRGRTASSRLHRAE